MAEERVANIRTVKALASEEGEKHLYGQEVDKAYQLARTEAIVRGLFYGSAGLAGNAIILTVLWHGGSLLLEVICHLSSHHTKLSTGQAEYWLPHIILDVLSLHWLFHRWP